MTARLAKPLLVPTSLVALSLALGACSPASAPSTTTTAPVPTTTVPPTTTTTIDPALLAPLPVDPEVRVGQLDNGLTYYIRFNDSPGTRAELRLVVDAGSVQEEDDQVGIAHFLEHMMFNGTERFPRNELTAVLESFGPQFGPHINAYTSFDETVYILSLSTLEPGLVDLGLDVLREWAGRATLTETDVVEERGVVLDEWRVRAQGFNGRISEAFQSLILPETIYENRVPIGTDTSIRTTTPDQLRRFYADWYRPDNMAVVAVGDFDVDEMESSITALFSDLGQRADAPVWEPEDYEPPTEPRTLGVTDEEATSASASVLWPQATGALMTEGDYQDAVAISLGLDILARRLEVDALRGEAPLLGASATEFSYSRQIGLVGIDVESRPEETEDALLALLLEVKRFGEFGITDTEFDDAIARYSASAEQSYEGRESAQDVEFAARLVDHHLEGGHIMSHQQVFDVDQRVIGRLTKADVEKALAKALDTAPLVLAIGPDDESAMIPDGERIRELMEQADATTVERRDESELDIDTLMEAPEPGAIASREQDADFGFEIVVFANGATAYFWETDIAEGLVHMQASSFGGTSVLDIEDLPEMELIIDIINRSGLGPADKPTLDRLLADSVVNVFPWVSETREGLVANAAVADAEVMMQLIHLYMTAPRVSSVALDAVLDEMATLNASKDDIPDLLRSEALNEGYYGENDRYFVIPSPEQLAEYDVEAAERVYRERFANAGDFAFAFVGDFDVDTMVDLAARYIGTLPGSPEREDFVDNQPLPPREVQLFTVEAGSDPQGRVDLYFTNPFEPLLHDRITARVLELIVDARLRDRIREGLSATYAVFTGIDLQRDPDPFAEAFVRATGDPEDLERISSEIMADLVDLQQNGPTSEQFTTAIEQLSTEYGLINNGLLADALINAFLYPDEPVVELALRYQVIFEITPEDVRDLARIAYNPDQRIEVRTVPRP
ncbi:MAG: insulinase family protein [Acidimicrobiia bacterium]|nr:insulinase family protein [Acidimicrobiia bacterium]